VTQKNCKICGGRSASPFNEKDGFRILKCDSCSVVFLDHDPHLDSLRRFYSEEYFESGTDCRGYESYEDCEKFLTTNFQHRIERLGRYVSGGRVLDVGCGYGYFLRCLGPEFQGVGIDISEYAVRFARERFGLDATAGTLTETSFPNGHFSLVTMWDVIEHLPDPAGTLAIVRTALEDDGVLALTTGDVGSVAARLSGGRWHLFTVPDHLWFFSERTLRELLDRTGFRVIELRREWCYYSVDYLVERFLKTVFRSRRPVQRPGAASWLARLSIPVNLFDIMYVVCRRK
jgi:SAM-dependent methyltransferase